MPLQDHDIVNGKHKGEITGENALRNLRLQRSNRIWHTNLKTNVTIFRRTIFRRTFRV